jgi:starvation-inducible DNA-binding protein
MVAQLDPTASKKADCVAALSGVLADTYVLYLKTHNFHWNVEGPRFRSLHQMFEEQYQTLWRSIDEIAERIRALGQYAPGTSAKFKALAAVKETEAIPKCDDMLRQLIVDNETVMDTINVGLRAAQSAGDEATVSLLSDRLAYHEKQLWMMRSTLVS